MNTYSIDVSQNLSGFYFGKLTVEASSEEEAKKVIDAMSLDEITANTDWILRDDYCVNIDLPEFTSEIYLD